METIEYKGYTININYEEYCESPRDCDSLGEILYTSNRYNLGDTQTDIEEIEETIKDKNNICLPVYAYIHGNVKLNTGGFNCPWDSGQSGIIYVSKDDIKKEYSVKRISKKLLERVLKYLKSEIEIFSNYLSGECFYFNIKDGNGEEIESLGTFYGYDFEENGLLPEARSIIDYHIQKERERKQKKLKSYIKNNVPLQYRKIA